MAEWYDDDYFEVQADIKSHTGGVLTMGKIEIQKKLMKQNINTKKFYRSRIGIS